MKLKILAIVLIILVFVIALAIFAGVYQWRSETKKLHSRMKSARVPIALTLYDPRELEGLPAPVQRYFRTVLKEGQPMVASVNIEHTGTFNMGKATEQWKSFSSRQRVVTKRPGFIWDARISMAPGITAHVHDAYIEEEGILAAKLFGLLTVMKEPSTPELALSELMRFFAEAAWYPTALLPSQGVTWKAIDDSQASATLTDGIVTVELVFHFNAHGLISSVRSDGRYRAVDGMQVAVPWQGRFWGYEMREGMLVPLDGEVEWLLPEGQKPYWRGRIRRIHYELTISK